MDQIHLSPLVDQIQLTLGHISNSIVKDIIVYTRLLAALHILFIYLFWLQEYSIRVHATLRASVYHTREFETIDMRKSWAVATNYVSI
jgi:hypothetical protein